MRLLFDLPLIAGVAVTGVEYVCRAGLDARQPIPWSLPCWAWWPRRSCFCFKANPARTAVAHGVTPVRHCAIPRDPVALGILSTTLMPHNLPAFPARWRNAQSLPSSARGMAMRGPQRHHRVAGRGHADQLGNHDRGGGLVVPSGLIVSSLDDARRHRLAWASAPRSCSRWRCTHRQAKAP